MDPTERHRRGSFQERLAAQAAARQKNLALLKLQTVVNDGSGKAADERKDSEPQVKVAQSKPFRVVPNISDNVVLQKEHDAAELPSIIKILLSAVVQTDDRAPLCILLPSTEYAAELLSILAALECLRADLPETAIGSSRHCLRRR